MKSRRFLGVILICSFSTYAYGDEGGCNLTIRKGHVSEDVPKILSCLNDHIKKLEADRNSVTSSNSLNDPAAFSKDGLTVSADGASRQQGDLVYVRLAIENKTSERILLGANGNKYTAVLAEQKSGLSLRFSNIEGMRTLADNNFEEVNWLAVDPSTKTNVVLIFASKESKECQLHLTFHLMKLEGKKIQQITVHLPVKLNDC